MRARDALAAALLVGCTSPTGPAPVTRLEMHAVPMVVPACDGSLTSWTVRVRETGERVISACDQTIVMSVLEPYEPYTLEITGYSAKSLCWRGTCSVTPLPGLGVADCPEAVADACADAGGAASGR